MEVPPVNAGMESARRALRGHISRLAVWSAACVAVSLASLLSIGWGEGEEAWRAFLVWNAGWCAVNLLICLASWRGRPPDDLRKLREFLMLNEGLNVGYVGVGVALALASPLPGVHGAGWGIALQGFALLVLDTLLLARLPRP